MPEAASLDGLKKRLEPNKCGQMGLNRRKRMSASLGHFNHSVVRGTWPCSLHDGLPLVFELMGIFRRK